MFLKTQHRFLSLNHYSLNEPQILKFCWQNIAPVTNALDLIHKWITSLKFERTFQNTIINVRQQFWPTGVESGWGLNWQGGLQYLAVQWRLIVNRWDNTLLACRWKGLPMYWTLTGKKNSNKLCNSDHKIHVITKCFTVRVYTYENTNHSYIVHKYMYLCVQVSEVSASVESYQWHVVGYDTTIITGCWFLHMIFKFGKLLIFYMWKKYTGITNQLHFLNSKYKQLGNNLMNFMKVFP